LLTKAASVIGAGFSAYQGVQAYREGETKGVVAKHGLDGSMALIGGFGGPAGAVASGGYFLMDTIGWKKLLPTQAEMDRPSCRFLVKYGK
jgi:hypothetical protein